MYIYIYIYIYPIYDSEMQKVSVNVKHLLLF